MIIQTKECSVGPIYHEGRPQGISVNRRLKDGEYVGDPLTDKQIETLTIAVAAIADYIVKPKEE